MFEIGIRCFGSDQGDARFVTREAEDAWRLVTAGAGQRCSGVVGDGDAGVARGDLYLWMNGDRALLRLDEHREWHARDPSLAADASRPVIEFHDDDGSTFSEPFERTITRAQAFGALACWLGTRRTAPELSWE